jgi:hypothetical protein
VLLHHGGHEPRNREIVQKAVRHERGSPLRSRAGCWMHCCRDRMVVQASTRRLSHSIVKEYRSMKLRIGCLLLALFSVTTSAMHASAK